MCSIDQLLKEKQLLLKHLGDCIEYIENLENSIERASDVVSDNIYEDLPSDLELDFHRTVRVYNSLSKEEA